VKSFINLSPIQDLKEALGQYVLYSSAIADFAREADRTLFLAIREETYNDVFTEPSVQKLIERGGFCMLIFNAVTEEIVRWIR
jgi:hypothetical protein